MVRHRLLLSTNCRSNKMEHPLYPPRLFLMSWSKDWFWIEIKLLRVWRKSRSVCLTAAWRLPSSDLVLLNIEISKFHYLLKLYLININRRKTTVVQRTYILKSAPVFFKIGCFNPLEVFVSYNWTVVVWHVYTWKINSDQYLLIMYLI